MNRNVCSLYCIEYSGKSFKRISFVISTAEGRITLNKHFTKTLKCIMGFRIRTPCLICCWLPPSSKCWNTCYATGELTTSCLLFFPFKFSSVPRSLDFSELHSIIVHGVFVAPSTPKKNPESVKTRIIQRSPRLSFSDARGNTSFGRISVLSKYFSILNPYK